MPKRSDAPNAIGHHIIHVGFLVHDRADEDKFYRDLLGFRPYWYGGMNERQDRLGEPAGSGRPRLAGVHADAAGPPGSGIPAEHVAARSSACWTIFSIGEVSVPRRLQECSKPATGWTDVTTTAPKIGKDGKGQFNLYDPDGIRLELMNFHATEKPCCSPFTADDPGGVRLAESH